MCPSASHSSTERYNILEYIMYGEEKDKTLGQMQRITNIYCSLRTAKTK
jgi:hypothetical protein